jgi:hypothetical protein
MHLILFLFWEVLLNLIKGYEHTLSDKELIYK